MSFGGFLTNYYFLFSFLATLDFIIRLRNYFTNSEQPLGVTLPYPPSCFILVWENYI